MERNYIYFDSEIRSRSGKWIPTDDYFLIEGKILDNELKWFHEGYGSMRLYRMLFVEHSKGANHFIAENMHASMWTTSDNWEYYRVHPEEYLAHIAERRGA